MHLQHAGSKRQEEQRSVEFELHELHARGLIIWTTAAACNSGVDTGVFAAVLGGVNDPRLA